MYLCTCHVDNSHLNYRRGYLVLVEILEKMWNKQISLLYWKLGFFDNLFSSHEILQDEIFVSCITLGSKMSIRGSHGRDHMVVGFITTYGSMQSVPITTRYNIM
jgi:hypothetical protein